MGARGPKSQYEPHYDEIRRLYVEERKTDEEIAQLLPIQMTANAVYIVRRKIGILSRRALGQATKLTKPSSEMIKNAWEKSFEENKYGKGMAVRGSSQRTAVILGVSASTAQQWLDEEGLLPKRPTYQGSIEKLIQFYVKENKTVYQIATELDLTELTVSSWLKRGGVEILPSQRRRTNEQKSEISRRISEIRSSKENKEKIQQSNFASFGQAWPNQSHLSSETILALSSRDELLSYLVKSGEKSVIRLAQELGCSYSVLEHKLKRWDLWSELDHYTSSAEVEIKGIYKALGVSLERTRSVIKPYEIDLYSAEHKIGIEFNGDYWHSEVYKRHDYHQKKSFLAEKNDVFLYHIFEYEWKDKIKREKILLQLENLFGFSKTIYARNCQIHSLVGQQKNTFLNKYHVQGGDKSSVQYGLFYKDELVSVMTFARPRFSQRYQWELSRLCSASGTRVVGGASKLFSHFVKTQNPTSVVSYSDIAKTRGGVYAQLGFHLSHFSSPNYVWTDFTTTLTRYQTQMVGERETMTGRGFVRIFDSGNKVWVWNNES